MEQLYKEQCVIHIRKLTLQRFNELEIDLSIPSNIMPHPNSSLNMRQYTLLKWLDDPAQWDTTYQILCSKYGLQHTAQDRQGGEVAIVQKYIQMSGNDLVLIETNRNLPLVIENSIDASYRITKSKAKEWKVIHKQCEAMYKRAKQLQRDIIKFEYVKSLPVPLANIVDALKPDISQHIKGFREQWADSIFEINRKCPSLLTVPIIERILQIGFLLDALSRVLVDISTVEGLSSLAPACNYAVDWVFDTLSVADRALSIFLAV